MYYLRCDSNEIASLDLSANQNLHLVAAEHNKLTTLDLQGKKILRGLFIQDNAIADAELNKIIAALPDVNGKVTEKITSGVNRLLPEGSSEVVHRLYYNLSGQQLNAEPTHGLYFIKEVRSNGTSTVRKVTK